MKKYNNAFFTVVMTMLLLVGCGTGNTEDNTTENINNEVTVEESGVEVILSDEETTNETLKIVTTIFPEYDWVKVILGENIDNVELTMLLDNGVDMHSYQATTEDIITISECDLFIYVGGESDGWVDDILEQALDQDIKTINLMDVLGDSVKIEEMVEGMQETEHDHDEDAEETEHDEDAEETEHDHDEDAEETEHDHDEEVENDEHVWLSLRNAQVICQVIAEALAEIDPEQGDVYLENVSNYIAELQNLDSAYEEVVENGVQNSLLFADRFPFRYLVDDYGLSYYAAFSGCSAETEASFETVTFLAEKLDEIGLTTVLTIENSDNKIADTVIASSENKNQQILSMNSLQSVTKSEIDNGMTYLSAMEDNLKILEIALE